VTGFRRSQDTPWYRDRPTAGVLKAGIQTAKIGRNCPAAVHAFGIRLRHIDVKQAEHSILAIDQQTSLHREETTWRTIRNGFTSAAAP